MRPGADAETALPQGRWQLVHRIESLFPGNHKALMMGALVLDSETGHLTCALMTVEGFTLFSAAWNDRLEVTRAVPPFDGPGFAEGLMADLRLLFFPPAPARQEVGVTREGIVRRYRHTDGRVTDVLTLARDRFRIDRYDANARRLRRAALNLAPLPSPGGRMAQEILLEATGDAGYTLRLDLIEAVPQGSAPQPPETGSMPKDAP